MAEGAGGREALREEIARLQEAAESWTPPELLRWGLERFRQRVAIASAFGPEGVIVIDMAARLRRDVRVFTLDTGFLFPETHALMEEVERRYGIQIERCRPTLTPEEQAERHGEALWRRAPDQCCELRKVQPLRAKLAGLDAWITGIRREQTPARANARKVEWDAKFGLAKLNPLADWSWARVWEYIQAHKVPYNALHDRNYPSIGCTHCTRPVQPGEGLRSGRWPGTGKIECGIHAKG
jgi:phosphoadenosine phosphosulfate reductase